MERKLKKSAAGFLPAQVSESIPYLIGATSPPLHRERFLRGLERYWLHGDSSLEAAADALTAFLSSQGNEVLLGLLGAPVDTRGSGPWFPLLPQERTRPRHRLCGRTALAQFLTWELTRGWEQSAPLR